MRISAAGRFWIVPGCPMSRARRLRISSQTTLKRFYRVVPNNTKQAAAGIAYLLKNGIKKGDQAMVVDDAEAYGVGIASAGTRSS